MLKTRAGRISIFEQAALGAKQQKTLKKRAYMNPNEQVRMIRCVKRMHI
jgi:hypothetical protein